MNERNTENLVRKLLETLGYNDSCIIEEQTSKNKIINTLLSKASKSGEGIGRPEFIIQPKEYPDTLIVIECKASENKLKSEKFNQPKDFAVDGAIHYAKFLADKYKVIAIGAVGEKELIIECYVVSANDAKQCSSSLLPIKDMVGFINNDPTTKKLNETKVLKFASDLHNYLRDYAKLSESEKPLLIGGILIALKDPAFVNSYKNKKTGASLASLITGTIKEQLQDAKMEDTKIKNMVQPYSFIETHQVLAIGDIVQDKEHPLRAIVDQLNNNIMPFINTYSEHDILGHFYGEFLSYTAGDKKGLGIVLTPKHIKELMCELCEVNKDSVVIDNCTGTGGFLITAMDKMVNAANGDSEKIKNIKAKQLIGIEQQPHMFALAVSNMMLRGDGKANIYIAVLVLV